ncbi:MAG: prepilin-type N-terminal cleavage/methylation domain-containing protein [Kiritimatiellae bacterium]|nr:prepilin-type N-terminal cleavage/methylation domain-containing protein [Kiritimatiellia bacterium]MDD5522858.1 prepilin-type N-terminal cleavage/methylation domain-containing protein [Kiritimatiellia bacterium]
MKRNGFSLTEVMLATSVFAMVMAGTMAVYFASNRSWYSSDVQMRCMREADMILQKMVYGIHGSNGLRSAIYTNVVFAVTGALWSVTYSTPDGYDGNFTYKPADQVIRFTDMSVSNAVPLTIGENVRTSSVTMVTNGLNIMVRVGLEDGRFVATNTLTTYVRYRN